MEGVPVGAVATCGLDVTRLEFAIEPLGPGVGFMGGIFQPAVGLSDGRLFVGTSTLPIGSVDPRLLYGVQIGTRSDSACETAAGSAFVGACRVGETAAGCF